jgi:hypothetical protein
MQLSSEDVTFLAKWSIKDSISKRGLPLCQNTKAGKAASIAQFDRESALSLHLQIFLLNFITKGQ